MRLLVAKANDKDLNDIPLQMSQMQANLQMRSRANSLTMVYRTLNTSTHQVAIGLCLPVIPGLAVHSPLTSKFFPIAPRPQAPNSSSMMQSWPTTASVKRLHRLALLYIAPVIVTQRLLQRSHHQRPTASHSLPPSYAPMPCAFFYLRIYPHARY